MAEKEIIWANLIHLSTNMWCDREDPTWGTNTAKPYMRFDIDFWRELIPKMADAGINMVVIDLGDGVKYESRPEIGLKDAWTISQLKDELASLRDIGIEPIPKINFSSCHDIWMGEYSPMLSTETYYAVCRDLIAEAIEIFDKPRFFHLGMDEETYDHQRLFEYVVLRQYDLWWHDLLFYIEQVEKGGSRPWIWSDYIWRHPEAFAKRMPKSVLQSNWYYEESFSKDIGYVQGYLELEKLGFEQIPTGSNWSTPVNFERTAEFAKANIAPERLLGFLQTTWKPTTQENRERHIQAIEQVARARDKF